MYADNFKNNGMNLLREIQLANVNDEIAITKSDSDIVFIFSNAGVCIYSGWGVSNTVNKFIKLAFAQSAGMMMQEE